MTGMYDPPQGRVADVERLLQVLALLRASETGVPRRALVAGVQAYAADDRKVQQGKVDAESLVRKMRLDLDKLREIGFLIEDVAAEGLESHYVLSPTPWRVPLDLDEHQQAVLSWVMRAAGVAAADDATPVPEALQQRSYASVLGTLPRGLGLVHAALAGRRALVVERQGEERTVEPVQLAAHEGRWYLLLRYPGKPQTYGYRLDRLDVLRLGDVLSVVPARVDDPRDVLDPTAWREHAPVDVEVRCDPADAVLVGSWFPRAQARDDGDEVVLAFPSTNTEAVVDRVLGLAGAARLLAPAHAVEQLRARVLPFAEVTA